MKQKLRTIAFASAVCLLAPALPLFQGAGLTVRAAEINGTELIPQRGDVNPADNGEIEIMPLSGIEDITAPTVTGIQLGAESVEAPGTLEVLVEATDDVSGANFAMIYFRNPDTGKELYVNLSASYYDQETGKEIAYEDGTLHGTLQLDQYASAGSYVVKYVEIRDKADNYKMYHGIGDESYNYYKENEPGSILPEAIAGISFSVTNSGAADITAPTAEQILLERETVEAPGQLKVTVEAVDDASGASSGTVCFRNAETEKELYAFLSLSEDGKLAGSLEVGQYTSVGAYVVDYVELHDGAGNYKTYYGQGSPNYAYMKEEQPESLLSEALANLSFSVVNNGTVDITAPTVAGVILKKDRVEVPAVIEVLVDGADDISGVNSGIIYFRNPDTGKQLYGFVERTYFDYTTGETREYEDGMLHGEVAVSHYTGTGNYMVEYVELRDRAGNYSMDYGAGADMYEYWKEQEPESLLPEACANLSFYVYNDGKGFDVTATTQTPNLAEQIKFADDQAEILVDYTSDSVLKKDVFDAVKGTGKTISLVAGDGVQWIFQGSDIVNDSKDIDLRVDMEFITQSGGEEAEAIEALVEERNTVILRFPENGILPGKAKIRVKADYSMRKYLGEEGIYVYYFDNTAKELVPIAANLVLTDDYYIEFEIEHCSYYIMTAGQVEKEVVPPEKPEGNAGSEGEKPGNNAGQEGEKPGNSAGQEGEKPGNNAGQNGNQQESNKNDTVPRLIANQNGQEAVQSVGTSPKTGEDDMKAPAFLAALLAAGGVVCLNRRSFRA